MGRNKRDVRPPFVVTLALSGLAACGGATDDRSGGVGGAQGGASGASGSKGTGASSGTGGRDWGSTEDPGSGGTAGSAAQSTGGNAAFKGENTSGSAGSGANPPAPDVPPDPNLPPETWLGEEAPLSNVDEGSEPACDTAASTPYGNAAQTPECVCVPGDQRYPNCELE
jgi:hypothetical protein